MTEWCVVKSGAVMFDPLHAYGAALVLATATDGPVHIRDCGLFYELQSPAATLPCVTLAILAVILALPTAQELTTVTSRRPTPLTVANLDGLLAALFTRPGPRVVSVADLAGKHRQTVAITSQALAKVQTALYSWQQKSTPCGQDWLAALNRDYDPQQPAIPIPQPVQDRDITVPMTLDPTFSYAARRILNDGRMAEKTNLTIRGPRYAPLLAYIGAARFLRAQPLADKLVAFYVPGVSYTTITPDSALPLLHPCTSTVLPAVVLQWLAYSQESGNPATQWEHLLYQVLQTQRARPSISILRGCLETARMRALIKHLGTQIVGCWQRLFAAEPADRPIEANSLLDCLLTRRATAWLAHLQDLALWNHNWTTAAEWTYRLSEVKEITCYMDGTATLPLSRVLSRAQGTMRFGYALRLLGRQNPAILREIIDDLQTVHTRDSLQVILWQAAQACQVALAYSSFLIVPDDTDYQYLLEDVEQYGARTIAGMLLVLSALRYPRNPTDSVAIATGGGTNGQPGSDPDL